MTWVDLREDRIVDSDRIMDNFEHLRLGQRYLTYTTAQRVALTQSVGLTVYDSDLLALFASDGYNWIQL